MVERRDRRGGGGGGARLFPPLLLPFPRVPPQTDGRFVDSFAKTVIQQRWSHTYNDRSFTLYTAASERPRNAKYITVGKEREFSSEKHDIIFVRQSRRREYVRPSFVLRRVCDLLHIVRSLERRHFVDNTHKLAEKRFFIIEYRRVHRKAPICPHWNSCASNGNSHLADSLRGHYSHSFGVSLTKFSWRIISFFFNLVNF